MDKFPEVITFRITSRCNYNCKYCLAPNNIPELELDKLKRIFACLSKNGAGAILLTGGEPTIREDFVEIVKEIRKNKLNIFLDTNGSFFFKYKDIIDNNISVLGLPIDFEDASYRDLNQIKEIIKILEYYKNKKIKPIIRIGTVVTKDNFKELERIGDILKNYPVDIWKIYEFLPQNINAINNQKELQISVNEFDNATNNIKLKFSEFFKIIISRREERNKAYFFIMPDGNVSVPIDNGEVCKEYMIGNIFDKDIIKKWKEVVEENNYTNNIKVTFSV